MELVLPVLGALFAATLVVGMSVRAVRAPRGQRGELTAERTELVVVEGAAGEREPVQLRVRDGDIGAIYVGSESHPYAVKPTGTIVQAAEAIVHRLIPGAENGWVRAGVDEFLRAYVTSRRAVVGRGVEHALPRRGSTDRADLGRPGVAGAADLVSRWTEAAVVNVVDIGFKSKFWIYIDCAGADERNICSFISATAALFRF